MNIPLYITLLFIVIVILIVYGIFYTLNYAFNKAEYPAKKKLISFILIGLLLGGWMSVSAAMAIKGFLLDFQSLPPRVLVIIIPTALAISYISISERVNSILKLIPKSWLINAQSFRILVEIFLWLIYRSGAIPVQMTLEGRNFDILIGLSAPFIAYFCFTKKSCPKITALLWNAAGLLLLTNILVIAILSTPSPMRKFFNEPSNTMIAYFPYIWLPALIVPFAYLLHILSFKQIMKFDED
jgi:hypothetical protein